MLPLKIVYVASSQTVLMSVQSIVFMGTFTVVSLYSHRTVSFGALVTAHII